MGYNLHITRAKDWIDSQLKPISQEEWSAIAKRDFSLRPNGSVSFENDDGVLVEAVLYSFAENFSIYFYEGRLVAKNPTDAGVKKMVQLATLLNAVVLGDDGEQYDENADVVSRSE